MKIEFIVPAYGRPHSLTSCVGSIFAQTNPNFKVHVVADTEYDGFWEALQPFQSDDRLRVTVLPKRYNDWGHTPRNYGLEHATEDWIVMTGDDNYYVPIFVQDFLNAAQSNSEIGLVFCNMVHNGHNRDSYHPVHCHLSLGNIDMGNFMTRRELIGDLRLRTNEFAADWFFIEDYMAKNANINAMHIKKWLYIHN